ncbi:putative mucin TcMUCII [Trypanosoma cruzi]|uniref:Mucin TcMUCII, putative n=2 Tax=Trypanosoma cruzi TaxID=5693 RepID=Q4CS40_TRYCC|nr:mucin TcMUCII, putative [Trypanosoma cruzi]EAN83093.1 mucin TcMUCII, putative [Trypanosoma cruzi]PWV05623.1 putative mucin TcMUCII [Trypanosoma cruzi]PWV05624.1 putative mucin TcMUCII [Trypanosoma cruzi]|eukprot:XP_804944.1 mucin TcMUCII [Trypanosoma cruzi strain CL Brener]
MMTCRLLCALLVLALCCCPSACVTVTAVTSEPLKPPQGTSLGIKSPDLIILADQQDVGADALSPPVKAVKEGKPRVSSNAENGEGATEQAGSEDVDTKSRGSTENSSKSVVKSSEQNPEVLRPNEEANLPTANTKTMTTTTTKAPATNTTTTTAPEAPSDALNSAEASTTTNTRAPSRLREIDGSLSSSAWVCAPLLLAVSALACTAVG